MAEGGIASTDTVHMNDQSKDGDREQLRSTSRDNYKQERNDKENVKHESLPEDIYLTSDSQRLDLGKQLKYQDGPEKVHKVENENEENYHEFQKHKKELPERQDGQGKDPSYAKRKEQVREARENQRNNPEKHGCEGHSKSTARKGRGNQERRDGKENSAGSAHSKGRGIKRVDDRVEHASKDHERLEKKNRLGKGSNSDAHSDGHISASKDKPFQNDTGIWRNKSEKQSVQGKDQTSANKDKWEKKKLGKEYNKSDRKNDQGDHRKEKESGNNGRIYERRGGGGLGEVRTSSKDNKRESKDWRNKDNPHKKQDFDRQTSANKYKRGDTHQPSASIHEHEKKDRRALGSNLDRKVDQRGGQASAHRNRGGKKNSGNKDRTQKEDQRGLICLPPRNRPLEGSQGNNPDKQSSTKNREPPDLALETDKQRPADGITRGLERNKENVHRPQERPHSGGNHTKGRRNEPRAPHKQKMTVHTLRNLLDKEPSEIALTLSYANNGFKDALGSCPVPLLLRVISKAFKSNSTNEALNLVFIAIKEKNFFNSSIGYFMRMLTEESEARRETFKEPITDVITIMEELIVKSPSCMTELLGIHTVLQLVIDTLSVKSTIIDDGILERFREFTEIKDRRLEHAKRAGVKKSREEIEREKDLQGPPNDFREIEIFPQTADMQITDDHYLRANKVKGKYEDLNHYLDVQFRLLREDFIAPLRDGIDQYMKIANNDRRQRKKLQDVRIYDSVRIIAPYCLDSGICYTLQFDVSRMRIRWQSSKRLIFGSLLCLSSDVFQTLYFATVVDRDVKHLEQGIVKVRFEADHTVVKTLIGQTFTMAETTAYFESYRHNLVGLQNIREGELPFENYIVKCESDVKPPGYIARNQEAKVDLRPLVDDNFEIRDVTRLGNLGNEVAGQRNYSFSKQSQPAKDVSILRRETWPPADLLHLDTSQYEAIHTALTKEFVITQGPPGTGKTYIGLKIVKALLHNKSLWSKNPVTGAKDLKPMLIVCYTNHALDQFLEGIISFYKGDILRVGGRSNSEIIKPINLHNFRQRFRHARSVPAHIFQARRDAKYDMNLLYGKINANSTKIEIASTQIMHEDFLQPFIGQRHYRILSEQFAILLYESGFAFPGNVSIVVEWLALGNFAFLVQMEGEAVRVDLNAGVQDQVYADELVEVEDEVDAMQAQRRLHDGNQSDEEEESAPPVDQKEVIIFETRKEANERKIQNAAKEQFKAVALNIGEMEEANKPKLVDDGEWEMQKKARKKLKKNTQRHLASANVMTEEEANAITDLWHLPLNEKWRLYRYWIKKYTDYLWGEIEEQENEYEAAASRYKEALMQEDKEIMRQSTVIGMTTTGAARYQSVLQEISPRIIVVEEAAEVLEAHILTTLSKGCEHLILIGDHKQLKPNPTVFTLAKDYNLDVSLFERMVSNGVRCDCLALQHRMRPEIAELMKHIYDRLDNHKDVLSYEPVKGISSDIYFINHTNLETDDDDLRSHSNFHEAAYIAGLCKYLLLQGYKPEQITVLTTYSGQLFTLKRMMPKTTFDGVKVTVVDNYQGEENDIVLLSLVRSSKNGTIGFLNVSNRVCVALSRAKKGFYVIGNFNLLASRSELWKNIKLDMERKQRLGEGLALYCQNHPDDHGIVASEPSDFEKAPEGGCNRKCEYRLDCGHVCRMFCHVMDKDHAIYECRETCNKTICDNGHRCKKKCYKKCGTCTIPVEKTLPKCGHKQNVPCQESVEKFICQALCTKQLSCGHRCQSLCGKACTANCQHLVEKTWVCGHSGKVKCFEFEKALCAEPCYGILQCEHLCSGTCGSCFEGRLHRPCKNSCRRDLVCGHQCKDSCNKCPPCTERCENRCEHSICNKSCGEPCAPCMEPCEWKCPHAACTNLCHEPCNRPRCDEPCEKLLTCGHSCIGLCGEPCPNDCRICDEQKVKTIFFGDEDEEDARFVMLEDCSKKCIIEYKAMDRYMDTKVEEGEIKLKACPMCRTPIRRNLRYGTLIKQTLQEIELVKHTVISNKDRIVLLEKEIKNDLENLQGFTKKNLIKRLDTMKQPIPEHALVAMKNQISFINAANKLRGDWSKLKGITFTAERINGLRHLQNFLDWVLEDRSSMTAQEIDDAQFELARSKAHCKILLYQMQIKEQGKSLDSDLKRKVANAEQLLTRRGKYIKYHQDIVEACLAELKEKFSGVGVTEEERLAIVQAMDLPKGHWFKCPNGHVYAIGDCGGATVESRCPECKSKIGGSGHRLRSDNQFAGEMDGARHAAWSEQANLVNFGFNIRY